jgi:hypothetical protein
MSDPFAGTWVLDPRRCRYESRPAPEHATYTILPDGEGYLVIMEWRDPSGTHNTSSYSAVPDGQRRPHPDAGIDQTSMTRVDARRLDSASFKDGRAVHRARRDLSEDGQELSITQIFRGADGETRTDYAVYLREG